MCERGHSAQTEQTTRPVPILHNQLQVDLPKLFNPQLNKESHSLDNLESPAQRRCCKRALTNLQAPQKPAGSTCTNIHANRSLQTPPQTCPTPEAQRRRLGDIVQKKEKARIREGIGRRATTCRSHLTSKSQPLIYNENPDRTDEQKRSQLTSW